MLFRHYDGEYEYRDSGIFYFKLGLKTNETNRIGEVEGNGTISEHIV